METMKAKVVNIYNKHHHDWVVLLKGDFDRYKGFQLHLKTGMEHSIWNHVLPNTVELHGYGKPRVNVGDYRVNLDESALTLSKVVVANTSEAKIRHGLMAEGN